MCKPKQILKCLDCDRPAVIAKRCRACYWKYRAKVNSTKSKTAQKKVASMEIRSFFAGMDKIMPARCEECDVRLPMMPVWIRRATMAHILPKRKDYGFPSVATNRLNIIFLCPDCHSDYDNRGKEHATKMKVFPLMRQRVQEMLPLLTDEECNRVPEIFL